ncbi:hypothetical protein BD310DRAFT_923603 [Dichomitus squalens]|uniref:Uncharacterized protein n=1 Tax=Dichomitus squalens TaxID=114155 RepID=A0A4Q9PYU9_9APHY|nr:hypothetical protein BD310DRAFT_923603 [Dichomitus squalens]
MSVFLLIVSVSSSAGAVRSMGRTLADLVRLLSNLRREGFTTAPTSSSEITDALLDTASDVEAPDAQHDAATPGGAGTPSVTQTRATTHQSLWETMQNTMQLCLDQSISMATMMASIVWFGTIPSGMTGELPSPILATPVASESYQ